MPELGVDTDHLLPWIGADVRSVLSESLEKGKQALPARMKRKNCCLASMAAGDGREDAGFAFAMICRDCWSRGITDGSPVEMLILPAATLPVWVSAAGC
ncbi:hypothetical protein ACLOJK_030851 [Asimina triloba]